MITKNDIKDVAKSINVKLTNIEISWILLHYKDAQREDPTGTWDLVVENLIHQCVEIRKDRNNYTIKITGGGTRKEIASALDLILKAIRNTPIEDIDGAEWEDCTMITEINKTDNMVECPGCAEMIDEAHLYCPNCGDENF